MSTLDRLGGRWRWRDHFGLYTLDRTLWLVPNVTVRGCDETARTHTGPGFIDARVTLTTGKERVETQRRDTESYLDYLV